MNTVVKIEIEGVPEVTENDVYLDIDGAAEECMQVGNEDKKPPLTTIKQERLSPIHWQWNPNLHTSSTDHDAVYNPVTKKKKVQTGGSDDEEVDVDTPYCGTLRGQTQARTEARGNHLTPLPGLLRLAEFSSLLGSRYTAQNKKPGHAKALEKSQRSQKRSASKKTGAGKKSTARRSNSRMVSNVAKKSTTKQSVLSQKLNSNPPSDVIKKTTAEPLNPVATVREQNNNAFSGISKLTSRQSLPDVKKPNQNSSLNVARKSTSKQANSSVSVSNMYALTAKSVRTTANPVQLSSGKSQDTSGQSVEHHNIEPESNGLDRIHSNEPPAPCPNIVNSFEKPHSDLTLETAEKSTPLAHSHSKEVSSAHGLNKGVLQKEQKTMFDFVEKSAKKIKCPVCCVEIVQWSLRGHLKTVHDLPLRTCTKCSIGFTDLDQYSEHYAFHLQQEENQIASILRSSYVRQRLTRKQRQIIRKGKQTPEAVIHKNPVSSLQRNKLSPLKRPQHRSVTSRSLSEKPFLFGKSPQKKILETLKTRRETSSDRRQLGTSSLCNSSDKRKSEEKEDKSCSHLSEPSSVLDLAEPSSPSLPFEDFSVDLEDDRTDLQKRCRSRSASPSPFLHTPPSKRQRLEECPADRDIVSGNIRAEAKVSLVPLEAACQPFNCKTCLKAFYTALACPGSFRQYFQHRSHAYKPSKGSAHSNLLSLNQETSGACKPTTGSVCSSLPSLNQETPSSVTSEEDLCEETDAFDKDEEDEAVYVSPPSVSPGVRPEVVQDSIQVSSGKDHGETSNYECEVCHKRFQFHSELLRHHPYHSYQFACGFCRKAYQQKADLFDHFEIVHGGKMRFRCKYCERRFEDLVHFQTHIKVHKDGTVVRCTVCNKKFSCSSQMLLHLKNSHGPCEVCGKKFLQEKEFVKHMKMAHVKQPRQVGPKRLYCILCARAFQTVQGFLSHKRRHLSVASTSLYARTVRTNRAVPPSSVAAPQNSAAASKEVNTSVRTMRERSAVVRPDTRASTSKPSPANKKESKVPISKRRSLDSRPKSNSLKCKVCHKLMHSLTSLKSHYSHAHNGVPLPKSCKVGSLHQCPKCDKHFFFQTSVFRHIQRAHGKGIGQTKQDLRKEKPCAQKCTKCGKTFGTRCGKAYLAHTQFCHAKQPHSGHGSRKDQPSQLKCVLCEKHFILEKNLKRHMIISHRLTKNEMSDNMKHKKIVKPECKTENPQLYLCRICNECFTTKKSHKLHQFNRHSGKSNLSQCRFCRKTFTRNDNLLSHIKTQHQGKLPFLCRGCNQEFNTSKAIFLHACQGDISKYCEQEEAKSCQDLTETSQTESPEYRYRCATCNIGFYIAREWTKHMQKHFDSDKKDSVEICQDSDIDEEFKVDSVNISDREATHPIYSDNEAVFLAEGVSSDDEQLKTGDICEGSQSADSMKTSHDLAQQSAAGNLIEEKESKPGHSKGTGLSSESQNNQSDVAGTLALDTADKKDNSSIAFESQVVHPYLETQDELSLHAFEKLYEDAWNSEYAADTKGSSTPAEGIVRGGEIDCGNTVHSKPDASPAVCVHMDKDQNKEERGDTSDGRFQSVRESLPPKEPGSGTEKEIQNIEASSYEELVHQTQLLLDKTVGEQSLENFEAKELISKARKDAEESLEEKFAIAEEIISMHEGTAAVVDHQNKEQVHINNILSAEYETSTSSDTPSLDTGFTFQICKKMFVDKFRLNVHKCDIAEWNTSCATVSPELTQTTNENSSDLSEKAVGLNSRNCKMDQSTESEKHQHFREQCTTQSPSKTGANGCHESEHVCQTEVTGTTELARTPIDSSFEIHQSQADNTSDVAKSDSIQTHACVSMKGKDQSLSLEKETQNIKMCDTDAEDQTAKEHGITGDIQQKTEGYKELQGQKRLVNSYMQKCVTVLRNRLALKDDAKLLRKGEKRQTMQDGAGVQEAQEMSGSENGSATIKQGNTSSVDGVRLTGTKYESTKHNIFDIISSENCVRCPECEQSCKDEDDLNLHVCGTYGSKEQKDAHTSVSSTEFSAKLASDDSFQHAHLCRQKDVKLNENTGMSHVPAYNSHYQTVSIYKEQAYENVDSTLSIAHDNLPSDDLNTDGDIDSHDSQNHVDQTSGGQTADFSMDPLKESFVNQNDHVPARSSRSSQKERNCVGKKEQDKIYNNDNGSTCQNKDCKDHLDDDDDDGKHLNLSLEVRENNPRLCVLTGSKDSECRLTEDEALESAEKKGDPSLSAVIPDDEDTQGTPEGEPRTMIHENMDVFSSRSSRMLEDKREQRLNIFDMLSSNSVTCPVCDSPYTDEHLHLDCQGMSTEQNLLLSSAALEQEMTCKEASLTEEAFISDKSESNGQQLGPADHRNDGEWVENSTQHQRQNDLGEYLPVGLYIRKHCTENHQKQEHTKDPVLCDSLPSENSVPEKVPVATVEKQNGHFLSETAASQGPHAESSATEFTPKINVNKMADKRQLTSGINTHYTYSPATVHNTDIVTDERKIMTRFMASKLNPKLKKGSEGQKETRDSVKTVSQPEESGVVVGKVQQDCTDHGPYGVGRKPHENTTRESVQSFMRRLVRKVSLEQDKKSRGNEKEPECIHEDAERHTQDAMEGTLEKSIHTEEKQTETCNTKRRSSQDGDEYGKQDTRSNIFDILSLDNVTTSQVSEEECGNKDTEELQHICSMPSKQNINHPPLSTVDCSSQPREMKEETSDFAGQPGASNYSDHNAHHHAQGDCSQNMEDVNNTSVQFLAACTSDNQTETELRKQLTELLLNSQQSTSSADHMSDSATHICDSSVNSGHGVAQCSGRNGSALSRNSSSRLNGPFEYLDEYVTGSGFSVRQLQQTLGLNSCKDSEKHTTNHLDTSTSKQPSAHEIETLVQNECLSSRSDQQKEAHENQGRNGVQRYVQNLRKMLKLDEGLLSTKKGTKHGDTAEHSEGQFEHSPQDENLSQGADDNQTASVRSRKSGSSKANRKAEAAALPTTEKRLNIFDVLSDNNVS
ncbi:uncharacterized protein LOC143277070 [Babylonia areolata]|uniref:uncharacterized protein LOC143277070 n=1 Tax=Babylonia areolata TaxID=304850 RepID=UPI003FD326F5